MLNPTVRLQIKSILILSVNTTKLKVYLNFSPVNMSPKSPNLDKIATETLFVGNDSHTHPEQHIKNIDDRMQAKVA